MKKRIFLSPPHMGGNEVWNVIQAFEDNYISPIGPNITAFEKTFSDYVGNPNCVALASGSAGIHLALMLSGVNPGDPVICSDLTFVASVAPASHMGARAVFVDAERESWNLDPARLEEALETLAAQGTPAKAVVAVHLYGQSANMDPIIELCARHKAELVEDAAESIGADYKGRHTGTFSRFGIFSFNGNKIITTGGGGMIACRDKADADHVRKLATQARDDAPHYEHTEVGFNYRMSNVLAGIGLGQMDVVEKRVELKRAVEAGYRERLSGLDLEFMPEAPWGRSNRWLTCVVFGGSAGEAFETRERVRLALEAENIESRPLWKPMHLQPYYIERKSPCFGGDVGEDLFQRGLCLPSGTALTETDLDRICEVASKAAKS